LPTLANPRHERFAQELAGGKTAGEAYGLAGFKPSRPNASRLQHDDNIRQRVAEILAEREQIHAQGTAKAIESVGLTKEWVITRLRENAERALQAIPALDSEGEPTGEYKYEGNVANRALELLGKELGMFIDRKEVGQPGDFGRMSDDELRAELGALVASATTGDAAEGERAKRSRDTSKLN
jgi:phage terminase small subunit